MSLGTLNTVMLCAKRARAYSAVCNSPGMNVGSNARNSRVFASRSAISSWWGRSPVLSWRCHSACWTSRVCSEASSDSVSAPAWVTLAQPRTSSSVGVCRPFSSLETFEAGQDSESATCRPVSPACWRSSRRRCPSAWRASWTVRTPAVLLGGKVVPSNRAMPGSIAPVTVLHDHGRVLNHLTAEEVLIGIEVHLDQQPRVEQPVIVVRQVTGLIAGQVTNLLTSPVRVLRAEHAKAAVIGQRHADHPDTRKPASPGCCRTDHRQPVLEPAHVNRLSRDELSQRLRLVGRLVVASRLQPEGCVLERAEDPGELLADEQAQRTSPAKRRTSAGISITPSPGGMSPSSASATGSVTIPPWAM